MHIAIRRSRLPRSRATGDVRSKAVRRLGSTIDELSSVARLNRAWRIACTAWWSAFDSPSTLRIWN
jgi:hypothetical protein